MANRFNFRAWDVANEEMFTPGAECEVCDGSICMKEGGILRIMQSTGLTDKNGKEIFEGDICKAPFGINGLGDFVGEVRYCDEGLRFVNDIHGVRTSLTCASLEIIGNIHENPELLEKV